MNTLKEKAKNGNTQYFLIDEKGKTILNFSKVEGGVNDVGEIGEDCFVGNYYDEDGRDKCILFDNDGNVIHKHLAQTPDYIKTSGHYLLLVDADKVDSYGKEGNTLWCVVDDMGNYIVPPKFDETPEYLEVNKIYAVEGNRRDSNQDRIKEIYLNEKYIGDWSDEQNDDPYNMALCFKSKNKVGLIQEGEIILEPKYDRIIWEISTSKGGVYTNPKVTEYLPYGIAILKLDGKYIVCYCDDRLAKKSDKSYLNIYQVYNEILGFVGLLCIGEDNSKYDFYYHFSKMEYRTIDAPDKNIALEKINQFISEKTSLEDALNP